MKNIETFSSENGIKYLFDGATSLIVPVSDELYEKVKKETDLDRNAIYDLADDNLKAIMEKWNIFKEVPTFDLDTDFIKKQINEYPFPQIVLGVTEDCNLRCKYCIFSGKYFDMRTHSAKKMSLETALKSVDYYISYVNESMQYAPEKQSVISFYGGEALLELSLIKKVVDHVKEKKFKTMYALTTNGTLLTKETVKYLVDNDFLVSISLDGSPTNHNRNRVFSNGHGSYKSAYSGLLRLKKEIERQGKESKLPILILTCYDDKTDMIELNDYFNEHKDDLMTLGGRASEIIPLDGERKSNPSMTRLFQEYLSSILEEGPESERYFSERIFGTLFKMLYTRNISPYGDPYCSKLSNSCVPGGKFFVDTTGNFHMCERINYNFCIGNCETGLDYEKVKEVLTKWETAVSNHCKDCGYKPICGICCAGCAKDDEFDINKACNNGKRKDSFTKQLSLLFSLLEKNPETFRFFTSNQDLIHERYKEYWKAMNSC